MRFSKRKLHFLFFPFLCWRPRNRKKKKKKKEKWKRPKSPIKIVFFFKVVMPKCEKIKKNGFLAKIGWHYLCQEGRKTRIFVHTICFGQKFFGPKQCKPGKTIKIVVSAEIAQKQKWHLFFWKRCFLTWVKKWVLQTVFLKSCVSWKHYFYSVFSKHSFSKNKNCMLKKTENL